MCEGGWDTGCVGRVGPIKDSFRFSRLGTQGPASLFLFMFICCLIFLFLSLYCVSFRVFIFFYESIYLGGGFKGSFFSSLSASML